MNHVFFHADIDGIFAAAIFMNKTGIIRTDQYVLHPMLSSARGERFKNLVNSIGKLDADGNENFIYVFDYQYTNKAHVWIDHHQNEAMGYEPILNKKICFDNRAKSTAILVKKYLEKFGEVTFDEGDQGLSLIGAANRIDYADYPNVDYVFTDKTPAMIMRAYLETAFPSEMMFCRLVETIAKYSLDLRRSIRVLNLTQKCVSDLEGRAKKVQRFLEIYTDFSLVRQKYPYQYPRYSENYVKPNIKYNVRVSGGDNNMYYIQVSYNRWCESPNTFNVGNYVSSSKTFIKGGGHFHIGSGVIGRKDLDKFLDELSVVLEKERNGMEDETGEGMEKVGVDKKNDPVEKKAQEMVKTGSVKDIDKAREQASDQKGKEEVSEK